MFQITMPASFAFLTPAIRLTPLQGAIAMPAYSPELMQFSRMAS
jgi:hypothetical protein